MELNDILAKSQDFIAAYALQALGAILTLIIGFWIITRVSRLVGLAMKRSIDDEAVRGFLSAIVSISLKVLLLLTVASMFGIKVTSFIAIFSALALAVGLALQGNLANFASGVLILVFRFFKVGDFVELNGHAGTVKDIHIFHTVLVALDNRLVIVPNGQVTGNAIMNYTAQGMRRHDLTVGIGYDDDIDKAKAAIETVIMRTPNVELESGYDIFIKGLGDSSVDFAVRFMAKNENFWPAYKYFFEHIKKEFDAQNIGIPFPQRDIHVYNKN